MNKMKKIMRAFGALSIGDWIQLIGVLGVAATIMIKLERKLEKVDERMERLEVKIERIDNRLEKTENLLNLDVSWRYLYQNDPARKHLQPLYHPDTRSLELVPVIPIDTTTIRRR